jgi:aerobic-type carbon monoxide dehydrogenase small subunit (CoxS/CutS family)
VIFKGKRKKAGVSRRSFLKGVGATSVAGTVLGASAAESVEAAEDASPVGPGVVDITLNINGQDRRLSVEPRTTLLDALRDRLDLTGSKKVCDRGTCGACTVMLDGRPIYACTMLAIAAQGNKITTIEGLGSPEKLSAMQAAFVEHDAQQCGFCTPGFVVVCSSLLEQTPDPSPEQLEAGLGGNLCRCGTYAGIRAAVLDVARSMKGDA